MPHSPREKSRPLPAYVGSADRWLHWSRLWRAGRNVLQYFSSLLLCAGGQWFDGDGSGELSA